MTRYEHAEYGGASTDVYGDYGPCDADGYVHCDGQQTVLNDGRSAVYYYGFGTPYVGDQANDNIGWFKVWDALESLGAVQPPVPQGPLTRACTMPAPIAG